MSTAPLPIASTPSQIPEVASSILQSMTREEKISLLAGVDDWYLHGLPRFGVPSIRVTDCGHGVTLCGAESSPATCFPTASGMAATWNVPLMEKVGRALGRETRALGCSILLGPKINLHRHPLNGRCFETFSEDPWLAGLLAGGIIRGIQAEGVGACVKAMAANSQQWRQGEVSSEVSERTLRELYLRVFQLAIEEGHPCAIMTAYNLLNGSYCSQSEWMIRKVIKGDWQFPGFVVSDWRAVHGPEVYGSGLDLEMPGPGKFLDQESVSAALDEGLLSEEDLNDKAARILGVLLTFGSNVCDENHHRVDTPENRAVALEVAEESITLLKNEGNLLPLDVAKLRRILVLGPNAAEARLGGGGSASVTPVYSISPLDGIREVCGTDVEVEFMEGCSLVGTMETITDHFSHRGSGQETVPGLKADFFNSSDPIDLPSASWTVPHIDFSWGWASPGPGVLRGEFSVRFSGQLIPPVSGLYRLGFYAQEGCLRVCLDGEMLVDAWDDGEDDNFEANYQTRYTTAERVFEAGKPVEVDLVYGKRAARAGLRLEWEVPGTTDRLGRVIEAARKADAVVICAGLSNMFEGGSHDRETIDIPEVQRQLIEKVVAANPRTVVTLNSGGVIGMPWEPKVPAILQAWYPGQEGGRALARILFGLTNPSGRLPDTIPHRLEDHASIRNYPGDGKTVRYEEEWFIGYRHFDHAGIEPHFPFGFGLSYTRFEYGKPEVSSATMRPDGEVGVRIRIRNEGNREGREVVQLYVRPVDAPLSRPDKELRAYRKVALERGEETEVTFTLGERELEFFDPEIAGWRVARGRYEILVGPHSRSFQVCVVDVV